MLSSEQRLLDDDGEELKKTTLNGALRSKPAMPRVLPDGTYATESALTSRSAADAKFEAVNSSQKPPLRSLILDGDYYLASVLSATLTKLVMRHAEKSEDGPRTNALRAEAMLTMISIIRVGLSQFSKTKVDEDSIDRIISCVRALSDTAHRDTLQDVFLQRSRQAFRAMVATEESKRMDQSAREKQQASAQCDDVLFIRQFSNKIAHDVSEEVRLYCPS